MTRGSMRKAVELVKRLVGSGLVEKTPSPDDRRQVIPVLTDKAETVLDLLSASHLTELRRSGAPMMEIAALIEGA